MISSQKLFIANYFPPYLAFPLILTAYVLFWAVLEDCTETGDVLKILSDMLLSHETSGSTYKYTILCLLGNIYLSLDGVNFF